jgi:hypothetical protein
MTNGTDLRLSPQRKMHLHEERGERDKKIASPIMRSHAAIPHSVFVYFIKNEGLHRGWILKQVLVIVKLFCDNGCPSRFWIDIKFTDFCQHFEHFQPTLSRLSEKLKPQVGQ